MSEKIGVVATPCQAFALAKMRLKPKLDSGSNPIDKLKLVIGLSADSPFPGRS